MSDYESDTESITPIGFPILEIPQDITERIFIWCLPTEEEDSPLAYTDIAPVVLGRVCSQWRKIALETPEIWTNLWVVGHSNRDIKLDALAVNEYAARSRTLPLNLKAYFHASTDGWREDNRYAEGLYALVEQLQMYAHRCRALDICFPDLTLVTPIVENLHHNGSAWLEELKIETDRLPEAGIAPTPTTHVPSLSRLRVLEFKTRTPSIPYLKAPVAGLVSRLRNVSIYQLMSWGDFYTWIKACPELEEAYFEVRADADQNSQTEQAMHDAAAEKLILLQLHIERPSVGAMRDLPLQNLHLPSMDNLELHYPAVGAPTDNSGTLENLKALLTQSRPPLKNLLFRKISAPLERIVSVLEEVPQLETFDADGDLVTDDLLRLLSVPPAAVAGFSVGNTLLPELRVFQVEDYFCDPPDVMATFIRSRWDTSRIIPIIPRQQDGELLQDEDEDPHVPPPEKQFLEVCINTSRHTGLTENEDVMKCVEEGFSLNLLSPGPSSPT